MTETDTASGKMERRNSRSSLPLNYASVTCGARIDSHSSSVAAAPNDFNALLTPMMPGEDPICHYAATPALSRDSAAWFVVDLSREESIDRLCIDWWDAREAGVEFTLEAWQNNEWVECLHESQGYLRLKGSVYEMPLPAICSRKFRFRLNRAIGQNRLLIRNFALIGPGPGPLHILMVCPDCHMMDRRVLQEAGSLQAQGYRITLVCGFECPKEEHFVQEGIEVHRYCFDWDDDCIRRIRKWVPTGFLRRVVRRLFRAAAGRNLRFKPGDSFIINRLLPYRADVVHVHDLPALKHGAHLARLWNVPLVYDAHEVYHSQGAAGEKLSRELLKQEKDNIGQVNLFITVSDGCADYFKRLHGRRPLVLMKAAQYQLGSFDIAACRAKLRQRAGLDPHAKVILFQGWISRERNLITLIRSAHYLPEKTCLLFIGYGDFEKELKEHAKAERLEEKVKFLGQIDQKEIMECAAGADLGVIPYTGTDVNTLSCCPNTLFEFLQAGVPIVANHLPFMKQLEREYGFVATCDFSAPQEAGPFLRSVIGSENRLRALRAGCSKAALELSWEVQSKKFVAAYEEMLGGEKGG